MIIQCTSCEKKFNVPDSAITAAGRLVQCSSCGNKWTQYPLKAKPRPIKPVSTPVKTKPKKKVDKKKGPVPYSKEYMQQKWGTSVQNYAVDKGLSKKIKKSPKPKKQKEKSIQVIEKPGFGFFSYIITLTISIIAIIGTLNLTQGIIISNFPFLEPYISHFFETINNFKIFILDFYR